MTDVDKLGGNDAMAVISGSLGDTIVAWLDRCAAKPCQPRVTAKADSVTLRAGDHAVTLNCQPESMLEALKPFKSDARWNLSGVKHNGYTDAVYRLNAARPGYVSTGKPRTNGTAQSEGNTQTVVLGNVARAKAAHEKAKAKAEQAKAAWEKAEQAEQAAFAAIADAEQAEQLHKAEQAKAEQEKQAKAIEQAKANKAALQAKLLKMRAEQARLEKLLSDAEQAA